MSKATVREERRGEVGGGKEKKGEKRGGGEGTKEEQERGLAPQVPLGGRW